MQLSCVHCGKGFVISPEQMGTTGRCPHCRGEIRLPKAAEEPEQEEEEIVAEPSNWWESTVSGLSSLVIHLVIIVLLALVRWGGAGGEGLAEDVLIGDLPSENLGESESEELSAEAEATAESSIEEFDEVLEVEPMIEATDAVAEESLAVVSPSSGGGDPGEFDLGAVTTGGGSMGGSGWEGMLQQLKRNGLDIVIAFDSTGSMGGEINTVKSQVKRIGGALIRLIPKARISLCTYRDDTDAYLVKGLPLTSDIQEIDSYLSDIQAGGGGDHPEAVHAGLQWAVANNQFARNARKVILVFGDAPPHAQYQKLCLTLASDFHRQHDGIVSTVTCRGSAMREFIEIAQVGGGEAFTTSNERQIMEQLVVLVFGSKHRGKVLEAFEMLDR